MKNKKTIVTLAGWLILAATAAYAEPSLESLGSPHELVEEMRRTNLPIPTGALYPVLNKVVDWSQGHTTVFVGKKKGNKPDGTPYAPEEFLKDLNTHIDEVMAAFQSQGLLGYLVYSDQETELAVMNWKSEDHMNKAFQSEAGKSVAEGGGRMFKPQPMVWEKMEKFSGALTEDILTAYLKRVSL